MNLTLVNTLADPAMSASRQSSIVGASVTLLVLSTVVVSLRLVSRWISRAGFWVGQKEMSLRETTALTLNPAG